MLGAARKGTALAMNDFAERGTARRAPSLPAKGTNSPANRAPGRGRAGAAATASPSIIEVEYPVGDVRPEGANEAQAVVAGADPAKQLRGAILAERGLRD